MVLNVILLILPLQIVPRRMTPAFVLKRQQRPVIATNVMQLLSELHHILTLAFVSTVTQHCHCNINQQLFV